MARRVLPIHEVTSDIVSALRRGPRLVLLAPPGAGKTTVVPGLLVDEQLAKGQVWVLEPRRLAARLAATRVAEERGGRVGHEVGYRVRFVDQTSRSTRIVYLTEGILTRRMVADPFLEGVGAVILDEFHERSIHADLALAFLREVQESRPELKVVVMSATLDPGPVAAFLGGCPIVESQGRAHPIDVRYLERPDDRRVEERVAAGVKRALREGGDGDILAFLPGAGEIARAERSLSSDLEGLSVVLPLHGELDPKAQDRAVAPRAPGGLRRVVLATNVAESSLTIPGVDTVVDGGLAKTSRYDPGLGVDHLELGRISRFSADQRAGRAGRLGPGRAFRMWTEAEHRLLPTAEAPEIARTDLASAVLAVTAWSGSDPSAFGWFERPPQGMLDAAVRLLRRLGALPAEGFRPTALGEVLADLPVHPRLGKLLLVSRSWDALEAGARVAALASERDVLRERGRLRDRVGSSDLLERLERLEAVAAGEAPERVGLDPRGARAALRAADRLAKIALRAPPLPPSSRASGEEALLRATLGAFPDRVARRGRGGSVQLAEGGSAQLAEESVVKDAELLVAVQLDGRGAGQRAIVRLASRVERAWLDLDAGGVEARTVARFDEARERVEVVRSVRFGAIELDARPDPEAQIDPSEALVEAARASIDRALPVTDEVQALLHRYAFLRRSVPELELRELGPDARLEVLPAVALGKRAFVELRAADLAAALLALVPEAAARIDQLAPLSLPIPSGRRARLRYEAEGPPVLSVKLQEVFGLAETPRVADGRVPVKMELLAPNLRPVQVTQDLSSFWSNTYAEVRKELRRRYPKHQWPEDPKDGIPSARARPPRR